MKTSNNEEKLLNRITELEKELAKANSKIEALDITERKQVEKVLRENEENYKVTLENLQVGVVVHSKDGSVLFSNPEASHILGLTNDQILGKELIDPSWNFVNEDQSIMKVEDYPVSRVIATEQKLDSYQVGVKTKDRDYITWVIVNANPVYLDNELDKIIVNFVDITERKQAEEATKEIRKKGINIPIIAQTAFAFETEGQKSLDAGCNDYISKPTDPEKLKKMENKSINNLIDNKYKFSDLIDIPQLTEVFEKFSKATGFTIGLVDNNSLEILIKTGWHDICVHYHRADKKASEVCKKSNALLFSDLEKEKSVKIVECEHGLYDCATPIIIAGKHVANLATGQLLMQKPDISEFKKQAKQFGFNEQKYLEALNKVPIISKQEVTDMMNYLAEFSVYIAQQGLNKLRTQELNKELQISKEKTEESENKLLTVINTIPSHIWLKDVNGVYLACNTKFEGFFGAKESDIVGKTDYDFIEKELADSFREHDKAAMTAGKPTVNKEEIIQAETGQKMQLETTKTPMFDSEGKLIGVLGIAHDIKKMIEDLVISKEKAVNADKMKDIFLAQMSHEIRTPINAMVSLSSLLKDDLE
ncbi:MAG: PocR ligand-binding domain-containing protein, partial [Melioribacteraceae bacterium]|nr:PocR ligand-binding domain-containing protein [Melioribacteraceae bacterium]